MTTTTHPDKAVVRQYMERRRGEKEPPPSPERIRQELGWYLVEAERKAQAAQ
jgi:hypothetical protein